MSNNVKQEMRLKRDREDAEKDLGICYRQPGQIFEFLGWDIRWWPFRMPLAQFVEVGMWRATREDYDDAWVSTTFGVCRYYSKLDSPVDLTIQPGWPSVLYSDEQRADVAKRAGKALLDSIAEAHGSKR